MSNSYVDDIKVKISEKYKPPCKISMPMSYSQRLSLNKQLQDNRPTYDFSFEKTVLEKTKEMKDFRRNLVEERRERLDLARKQFDEKIEQEKLERLEKEQAKAKLLEETTKVELNKEQPTQSTYNSAVNADPSQQTYLDHSTSQNQQNYITKNGILMPIPVSSYSANSSNILNPIPMSNVNFEPPNASFKPFNLSDFESDTSSPFDNMELKSINDLEELAQVLKSDRTSYQPNMYQNTVYQDPMNYNNTANSYSQLPANTKSYNNFSQNISQPSRGYEQGVNVTHDSRMYRPNSTISQSAINYSQSPSSYSQINTNFNPNLTTFSQYNTQYQPQNTLSYVPSGISNYSNLNGYYYNTAQMPSHVQLGPTHSTYTPYVSSVTQPSMQKFSCKSVPDLVKSVEKELDITHLNDTSNIPRTGQDRIKNPFYTNTNIPVPTRPKSTDAVYSKTKVNNEFFNPFDRLSKEQKEICRNVSVMGFPLDRVARVCLVFGSDQKKIVDHLLALSDLLDLGFSENVASEALAKNDNDRDKALDILIT